MRIENSAGTGRYEADLRPDGLLAIIIRGVWSGEDVDDFFAALAPLYAEARRRHGRTLTLIVVEAVQSPAIAMRVRDHALALRRDGDRRAFVVATFLSKLQVKRLRTSEAFGLFTDRAAAEAWLHE